MKIAMPGHEHRLAPVAVRQASVDELSRGEAEHVADDDDLAIVGVGDAQRLADRRQRRQHDVDRQRRERHHHGDEPDELGASTSAVPGGAAAVRKRAVALGCVHVLAFFLLGLRAGSGGGAPG